VYIKQIKVVNFRSLTDSTVALGSYTALTGLNDTGKSNLFRALNLFFNGQTDIGHELVFANDFSQHAKRIAKKAPQIEIEIEFAPPTNYADSGPVVWRKTFRADFLTPETDIVFKRDGSKFARGSRTEYWVRHLAFEYVPAIRGRYFFDILKRRLYTTLSTTVAPKITGASSAFLADLRKEVSKIESESERLLSLKTEFALPSDLGELFQVLDFRSADSVSRTALQSRGDGIQGRHVPLILKFLADQRKKNSVKGKPPSETIWGYEEPENNLELIKQVEVAKELKGYSSTIQVILSTHSPAFYGVAKEADGIRLAIREDGRTRFLDALSPKMIDEHLGLMPFVQPYIEQAVRERDELVNIVKGLEEESLVGDRAALYVEGSSDKKIISAVLRLLSLSDVFAVMAKDGLNGGVDWVVGCCVARAAMYNVRHKTAALFDDDTAGKDGAQKIQARCEAIARPGKIKCFTVGKINGDDEIRALKKSGVKLSVGIEEVCGKAVWDLAFEKGWLEQRDDQVLLRDNSGLLTRDKTLSQVFDKKVTHSQARRILDFRVTDAKKGAFANAFVKMLEQGHPVPATLCEMVKGIHAYFAPIEKGVSFGENAVVELS
jgi:hypothetical protein